MTPTSRASVTRRMVEWPVIMITGAIGLGLSGELRSRRTKSIPSSGCIARSVMMMSIWWVRSDLQRLGPVVGFEHLAHADGAQDLGEQHPHVVVVVHQQDFEQFKSQFAPALNIQRRQRRRRLG